MPKDRQSDPDRNADGTLRDDEVIPRASEDDVLEETARLAREGRKELDADPKERKPGSDS